MMERTIKFLFSNRTFSDIFRNQLQHNFRAEKKAIKSYVDINKKTLDYGCGTGNFSIIFNKKKYLGIDIDNESIEYAKKKKKS